MVSENNILLFDGYCNLCSKLVRFVIKRDPAKRILFSALSSDMGMSLLEKAGLDRNQINSVVFFSNGKYFLKSLAILKLLRLLGGGWQLFYIFIIIPAFIRDFLYDIVARNRYRIFGTSKTCMIPDTETENRFL